MCRGVVYFQGFKDEVETSDVTAQVAMVVCALILDIQQASRRTLNVRCRLYTTESSMIYSTAYSQRGVYKALVPTMYGDSFIE